MQGNIKDLIKDNESQQNIYVGALICALVFAILCVIKSIVMLLVELVGDEEEEDEKIESNRKKKLEKLRKRYQVDEEEEEEERNQMYCSDKASKRFAEDHLEA